jgi:hypothetical protein
VADTADTPRLAHRSGNGEHGIPVAGGLAVLAALAGVAGAFAGAEPVGVTAIDVAWSAVFSSALVLAASRSRRLPTTVLAGVAGVIGVGGDTAGIVFGVLSLVGAMFVAGSRTRDRLVGGLVGLVAGQALLRGPTYGFDGLATLVAAAAVLPVFVSAWRIARTRERRIARTVFVLLGVLLLVGTATAGVAAFSSRAHFQRAADRADDGLDHLRDGDTAAAADSFAKAQVEFERASSQLDGPMGLLGRAVPVVAPNLEALRRVSATGAALGATASQAAATANWRDLTALDGRVDVEKVRSMQAPIAESSAALDAALATVADVRSPWLLPQLDDRLDRFDEKLSDAADEASIAAEGLAVAPDMLGGNGPRRYFVAFATPGETRNAGGFMGAYAIIDAVDGQLSVTRTGNPLADLVVAPEDLTLPQGWNDLYGSYEVNRFPGNLTASPDWPTDAVLADQIYRAADGGSPVDGVIYADPAALAALLELTGPVTVAGITEPLTSSNAEQYLYVDQYLRFPDRTANLERKDVLGEVATSVFDALTSRALPGIRTLSNALGPAVSAGHLRVASVADGPEAAFLRRIGIAGALAPPAANDQLSLRSSNLIASKIDVFLHRSVDTTVHIDPSTGAITTTVEVTLRNDAPSSGMPAYVVGADDVVPSGTNRDLLSLYTPLSLAAATVDGEPAGVQAQEELGSQVYRVPVDIPAGGQVVVRYTLEGPPPAALAATGRYVIEVIPQPLANPDTWNVEVSVGDEAVASSAGSLTSTLKIIVPVTDRS